MNQRSSFGFRRLLFIYHAGNAAGNAGLTPKFPKIRAKFFEKYLTSLKFPEFSPIVLIQVIKALLIGAV